MERERETERDRYRGGERGRWRWREDEREMGRDEERESLQQTDHGVISHKYIWKLLGKHLVNDIKSVPYLNSCTAELLHNMHIHYIKLEIC